MELDMTKGALKLITKFIIPIIIGNIFQQLYSLVDTVIVGRYVGVKALAAVGATGTIMFLILGFLQGLTTGFTILTAQRFGAGDMEGMKKSVGNAAVLSLIVTVVMTLGSVLIMDWLLRVMRTPVDIMAMSKTYILIICWGMGFNVLYNLLSSILRAVGNSKVPLYFLILSAGINIAGDLILIICFKMGVAGAAIATIASQGISGLLCLVYMIKKVPMLSLSREHLRLDLWCAQPDFHRNPHGAAVLYYGDRHDYGTGGAEYAGFHRSGRIYRRLQGRTAGNPGIRRHGYDNGYLLRTEQRYQ